MRKIFLLIVILLAFVPGVQTNALDIKVGEEVAITEETNTDLYIAGGRVDIEAPINGDLIITGGELNINSEISEDLIIAGGNININSNIGDDARIAGGNININSNIEGDLLIGGGNIRIDKNVVIKGDLVVGAGRIIMNGEVKGNAKIGAGELVLNGVINGNTELAIDTFQNPSSTGIIKGNINYKSKEKIQILEDSTNGIVKFEKTFFEKSAKKTFWGFITSFLIVKIIGLFLFATLIYLYFEKLFGRISDKLMKKTGKSFIYGFLTIVGIPVIIILLFISIIGIPFALFLLFAYIFIFVFLNLLNIMVFSALFIKKYKIKELYKKLLIIFGLSLLLGIINGIGIIIGFFTLGAIALIKIDIIKSLKK